MNKDVHPRIYKTMPARHLDGSSTPSHAKDTPTAARVKNIVMLGLRCVQQEVTLQENRGDLQRP